MDLMRISLRAFPALFLAFGAVAAAASADVADGVHPDFELKEIRMPATFKTMGLGFLKDGTLVLGTTDVVGGGEVPAPDANHKVYLVEGASTDSLPGRILEISNSWKQISGVTVVDDRIYVSDRDGFYEIPDAVAPKDPASNRRLILKWPDENHWKNGLSWHQWVFTPLHRDGHFYAPYSGSILPGGWSNADATSSLSGAFLKWDLAGNLEAYAGGLRSPNGANLDPATGEMFVTDNQGSWLPSSTFMRIRKGRFYGHRQTPKDYDSLGNVVNTHAANFAEELPYEPPVAWLPHGLVRSSPSQPVVLGQGRFAGDWLIGDVNGPGLVRVSLDRVGEAMNGAVFWFSKGTGSAAINRLATAPDGGIVIGTITRIGGNWPGGEKSPLFRLAAREQPAAFDIKSVRSIAGGLELEFTQPVNPDSIGPDHFQVKSWRYIREWEYGLGRQMDEARAVTVAEASKDRRRVRLVIPGLPADRVVHVKAVGLASSGGKLLWNNEAWFTLNTASDRIWDGEAVTAVSDAAHRATPRPLLRASALPGALEVSLGCRGLPEACAGAEFEVSLFRPDGTLAGRNTGRDGTAIRFSRPGESPAVHILRARPLRGALGNISVTQRVVF
jgi:glucose/arabinose dehydrogenase